MGVVDPGLQSLFMLLRSADIPVRLEEIRRLGAVFATAPALDEVGLRQVIEAVCVKSEEQRKAFRRIYDAWLAAMGRQLARAEAQHEARRDHARKKRLRKTISVVELPALSPGPERAQEEGEEESDEAPGRAGPGLTTSGDTPGRATVQPPVDMPREGLRFPVQPQSTGERDALLPLSSEAAQARAVISPGPLPGHVRARRGVAIGGALALIALVVVLALWSKPAGRSDPDAAVGTDIESPHGNDHARARDTVTAYQPRIDVVEREGPPLNWPGYGMVALALGFGAWLLVRRGRGRWLPGTGRAHQVPAPVAVAGSARGPGGALFLDANDEENLVWGVGRFVADEPSRDLDIDRTVHETAAAYGRPVLRYQAARYNREVWLWVDESMNSPVARHLARDLARTLRASGLPVTTSTFWGVPHQLRTTGEAVVTMDELDGQRDTAAVAILTDGRLMHAAHRALDRNPGLHELLRNLSFWPRVTFIDFSRGCLGAIVEPHGLRVIAPQDAPAAVSELAEGSDRPGYSRLVGDARVWAAACALSPRPVDDPTALRLRQMLGLTVSPWAIETLRERADHSAGGLSWSCRGRAGLMSWLLDAEELPEQGLPPPDSLLARTVAAWDRLLVERERELSARNPGWEGSRDHEVLRMERAFVHLWDRPDEAASTLYELFAGRLRATIGHHLSELAPRECADHADSIPLPWLLRDQRRETQVMLAEMGLGARAGLGGRRSLPRPGRLMLALSLCAGLAAGGSYRLIEEYATRVTLAPQMIDARPEGAKPFFHELSPAGEQRWAVSASAPWFPEVIEREVMTGQDYRLTGEARALDCRERGRGFQVLRCCQDQGRPALGPAFADRWSFAVLPFDRSVWDGGDRKAWERGDRDAVALADRLLCSGSVDAVYLMSSGEKMPDWAGWAGSDPERSQLLVVSDARPEALDAYRGRAVVIPTRQWHALLDVTDFEGTASLAERVPGLEPLAGDAADFLVQGMGACGKRGQPCCSPGERFEFCELGLVCEDHQVCVDERVCEPGAVRCERDVVMRCNATGTAEEARPCDPGEVCSDGRCVAPCEPGLRRCAADGTAVETCPDQSGRVVRDACDPGELCQSGACYGIESAEVTFRVDMPAARRDESLWLSCAMNGEEVSWRLGAVRLPGRSLTVPFTPRRPRGALKAECVVSELKDRAGEQLDESARAHPWNRSSEGAHVLGFRKIPELRVKYAIRIHLAAPGGPRGDGEGERAWRRRGAEDAAQGAQQ